MRKLSRISQKQSKKQVFFPYPFQEEALDLAVTSVELDGHPCDEELIDHDSCSIILLHENWKKAKVGIEVAIPEQLSELVLPPSERNAPPWATVVVADCDLARWRESLRQPVSSDDSTSTFDLSFDKDALRGSVRVQAILVRTKDLAQESDGRFAALTGMRLASSNVWTIQIDEMPSIDSFIEIKWDDFSKPKNQFLNAHPDVVYYLDFTQDPPVLWLNEAIRDLKTIIHSSARRGQTASVRDALFHSIAQPVWMSLIMDVVNTLADEKGEPSLEWQKSVLRQCARLVFPDNSLENAQEEFVKQAKDPSQVSTLLQELLAALQKKLKVSKSTESLLGELE